MKSIEPYLMFYGECREAMAFYQSCLGGDLEIMPYEGSEVPHKEEEKNLVLHATLRSGPVILMAADNTGDKKPISAASVNLSIDCSTEEEIKRLFEQFAAGGKVSMPLQDTFWGATFAMCTDKYGIHWMFNYDKPNPS